MSREKADHSHTAQVKPGKILDVETNEFVSDILWSEHKDFPKPTKKTFGQENNQAVATQVPLKKTGDKMTEEYIFVRPWRKSKESPKNFRGVVDVIEERVDVEKYDESRTARVKPIMVNDGKTSEAGGNKAWKQHVEVKNVKNRDSHMSAIQEIVEEPEKDGTELDFNVSVYSQDETDSEDTTCSDFMRRHFMPFITSSFQSTDEGSTFMHYNSSPMGILQDPRPPAAMERVHNEDYMGPSFSYGSLHHLEKDQDHSLHNYVVDTQHNFGTSSKVIAYGNRNTLETTTSDGSISLEESKANDTVSVLSSDWKIEPGPSKSKHDVKRSRNMLRMPCAKKEKQKVLHEEDGKRKFLHGPESPSRDFAVAVKKAHYGDPELYNINKYGANNFGERMYSCGAAMYAAPDVPVCNKNSDGLQQLQNYASDDDCYFHLTVDSEGGTSPKLVMESKESQSIMTSNQSYENSKFTTVCEIWRNEASPSQIKLDSENRKEKYMKSITTSEMQDSSFEEATSSEFSTTSFSSDKSNRLSMYCTLFPGQAQKGDYNVGRGVKFQKMFNRTTESQTQVTDLTWQGTKTSKYDRRSYHYSSWKSPAAKSTFDRGHQTGQVSKPSYDDSELATKAYCPGFIDSHCHLDFLFQRISHLGNFRAYKLRCETYDPFPVSFEGCVSVFCEPWTFRKVSWWEDLLSDPEIWGAFGCHPHYVSKFQITEELHLRHALLNAKVVALGEIGLDYSGKNNECKDLQQKAFRKQLEIALEFKKPLVIHCRDAHADCISILKEMVPHDYIIHRHCFTDSWEEAQEWMSAFCNLFLGFTGLVTQANRRARMLQDVVRKVPLEKILLETDAPYFRPNGLYGYSHPGMAIHVAAQIAYLKKLDIQVVLKQARHNTQKMYGI